MLRYSRNCVLDICDLDGNKICPIYDNSIDINNQAFDVFTIAQRNGWKTVTFSLVSNDKNDNFIAEYIRPEYKIRLLDDDGIDWYVLDKPKITHSGYSKTISVTADHCSSILKYRRLDLEFADDKLNNFGTCAQLVATVLKGTEWEPGDIVEFKEKYDPTKNKIRSLQASTRTGAFNLIAKICDLFEAKPIYRIKVDADGKEHKVVDVIPMNPFTEKTIDKTTGLPDLSKASNVLEINYGVNMKAMSKTLNSDNIITKLSVYGSYEDSKKGYCGIEELEHQEYTFNGTPGNYSIEITNRFDTAFKFVNFTLNKTGRFVYSNYDRQSMTYLYDETNDEAVHCTLTTAPTYTTRTTTVSNKKNWASFILDFTYYSEAGILTERQFQAIAKYQHDIIDVLKVAYDAAGQLLHDSQLLAKYIGQVKIVKLAVKSVSTTGGDTKLVLDTDNYENGVVYRSDAYENPENYFKWRPANDIKTNGKAINPEASVIYAIHNTGARTYDRAYLKTNADGTLTTWGNLHGYLADSYYLVASDSINGALGSIEETMQTVIDSANAYPKGLTVPHPVYWIEETVATQHLDEFEEYAWLVKYSETAAPRLYFCYKPDGDTGWNASIISTTDPGSSYKYWYNPASARLYQRVSGAWKLFFDEDAEQTTDWTSRKNAAEKFSIVQEKVDKFEQCWKGIYEQYKYTATSTIPVGNYYFDNGYNTAFLFTTQTALSSGDSFTFDTVSGWITPGHQAASSNVLSGATWTYGDIRFDGTDDESETKQRTGFIAVPQDMTFAASTGNYTLHFYNKNQLHIKEMQISMAQNVVSPANTAYVRVCKPAGLNVSLVKSSYNDDPINPTTSPILDSRVGKNLPNICEGIPFTPGEINDAGEDLPRDLTPDTTKVKTTYIRCYEGMRYTSAYACKAFFYTSKNSFLQMHEFAAGSSWTLPLKAYYVRFMKEDGTGSNFHVVNFDKYIILNEKQYLKLENWTGYGELNGLYNLAPKMKLYADLTYKTDAELLEACSEERLALEETLVKELGECFKESTWINQNYVNGHQNELFFDGIENLDQVSRPIATYEIQFLDLYNSDPDEYVKWPDINIQSALHIIDVDMGENRWGIVEELRKCYDLPWKTTLRINTDLSTITNKTFSSVMSEIADVSDTVVAHDGIVSSVADITSNKQLIADKIQGTIDASKAAINGAASSWYTDDRGNMIFESSLGNSAMKLCGNGFAVASNKDEWGDWIWSTFGTGEGFTADLITGGTIRGNLIEAGSITTSQVVSGFGEALDISSNVALNLFATVDGSRSAGSVNTFAGITIDAEHGIVVETDSTEGVTIRGSKVLVESKFNEEGEEVESSIEMHAEGSILLDGQSSLKLASTETSYIELTPDKITAASGDIEVTGEGSFSAQAGQGQFTINKDGDGAVKANGTDVYLLTNSGTDGHIYLNNESNFIDSTGKISLHNGTTVIDGSDGSFNTAGTMNVNAGGSMNINSTANLNVVAGGEVNISGGNVVVDSNGSIDITSDGTFTLDSEYFDVDEDGKITATGGLIGGWTIGENQLSAGVGETSVVLNSDPDEDYGIWAGGDTSEEAPFRVCRDGTVVITKLERIKDPTNPEVTEEIDLRQSLWQMDVAYNRSIRTFTVEDDGLISGTIKLRITPQYAGSAGADGYWQVSFPASGWERALATAKIGTPIGDQVPLILYPGDVQKYCVIAAPDRAHTEPQDLRPLAGTTIEVKVPEVTAAFMENPPADTVRAQAFVEGVDDPIAEYAAIINVVRGDYDEEHQKLAVTANIGLDGIYGTRTVNVDVSDIKGTQVVTALLRENPAKGIIIADAYGDGELEDSYSAVLSLINDAYVEGSKKIKVTANLGADGLYGTQDKDIDCTAVYDDGYDNGWDDVTITRIDSTTPVVDDVNKKVTMTVTARAANGETKDLDISVNAVKIYNVVTIDTIAKQNQTTAADYKSIDVVVKGTASNANTKTETINVDTSGVYNAVNINSIVATSQTIADDWKSVEVAMRATADNGNTKETNVTINTATIYDAGYSTGEQVGIIEGRNEFEAVSTVEVLTRSSVGQHLRVQTRYYPTSDKSKMSFTTQGTAAVTVKVNETTGPDIMPTKMSITEVGQPVFYKSKANMYLWNGQQSYTADFDGYFAYPLASTTEAGTYYYKRKETIDTYYTVSEEDKDKALCVRGAKIEAHNRQGTKANAAYQRVTSGGTNYYTSPVATEYYSTAAKLYKRGQEIHEAINATNVMPVLGSGGTLYYPVSSAHSVTILDTNKTDAFVAGEEILEHYDRGSQVIGAIVPGAGGGIFTTGTSVNPSELKYHKQGTQQNFLKITPSNTYTGNLYAQVSAGTYVQIRGYNWAAFSDGVDRSDLWEAVSSGRGTEYYTDGGEETVYTVPDDTTLYNRGTEYKVYKNSAGETAWSGDGKKYSRGYYTGDNVEAHDEVVVEPSGDSVRLGGRTSMYERKTEGTYAVGDEGTKVPVNQIDINSPVQFKLADLYNAGTLVEEAYKVGDPITITPVQIQEATNEGIKVKDVKTVYDRSTDRVKVVNGDALPVYEEVAAGTTGASTYYIAQPERDITVVDDKYLDKNLREYKQSDYYPIDDKLYKAGESGFAAESVYVIDETSPAVYYLDAGVKNYYPNTEQLYKKK